MHIFNYFKYQKRTIATPALFKYYQLSHYRLHSEIKLKMNAYRQGIASVLYQYVLNNEDFVSINYDR